VFVDSLDVLDGVWVHIQQVPEPEERKGFRSTAATGENADEMANRGPRTVGIVTAIHEGGAPWEGGGGVPEAEAKPAAKPAAVAAKPGPKAVAKVAPAPVEVPAGDDEEAVKVAAINAVSAVLGQAQFANGTTKLLLRANTFKALQGEPDMAQAVTNTFFSSDDALNGLLGELGYKVQGGSVVVA
jgi:hypothetical protein